MNWEKVKTAVLGCKDVKELEKELSSAGVEHPVDFLISASSAYAYSRAYRAKRNQSMTALKARIVELEAQQ